MASPRTVTVDGTEVSGPYRHYHAPWGRAIGYHDVYFVTLPCGFCLEFSRHGTRRYLIRRESDGMGGLVARRSIKATVARAKEIATACRERRAVGADCLMT